MHFYFASLSVPVLFNFNLDSDFIEHCNLDATQRDVVVFCVKVDVLLECHQALQAKPTKSQ